MTGDRARRRGNTYVFVEYQLGADTVVVVVKNLVVGWSVAVVRGRATRRAVRSLVGRCMVLREVGGGVFFDRGGAVGVGVRGFVGWGVWFIC